MFLPKFQTNHLVQKHGLLILMGDTQSLHAIIIPAHSTKLPEICLLVFFQLVKMSHLAKIYFKIRETTSDIIGVFLSP